MYYSELTNEFWKQNGFMPFGTLDISVYFYLVYQCAIRGWHNPFQLQTRDIEFHLSITRKQIGESKNRLKQRGLIDFTVGSRKDTPSYTILGIKGNMFPTETQTETYIETQLETYSETQTETYIETQLETPPKERSPIPPKEYTPKESDVNNNIPLTRTREEIELDRFDELLQEVIDGKHQIWEDQMRVKHGIDSVRDYLPAFRNHVIANAKMSSVTDVNGFKKYFNVSFRFFTRANPIEILDNHLQNAQSEDFRKFCEWIKTNADNVARGIVPLTEDEFRKLKDVFGSKLIFSTVLSLNERRDLIPKYFSLYRTLLNWCRNGYAK